MAETIIFDVVNTYKQRTGGTPPGTPREAGQGALGASSSITGARMPAAAVNGQALTRESTANLDIAAYSSVAERTQPQKSLFLNVFSEVKQAVALLPVGHESVQLRYALMNLLTTVGDLHAVTSGEALKLAQDLNFLRQQYPEDRAQYLSRPENRAPYFNADAPPKSQAGGLDTGTLDESLKVFIAQQLRNLETSLDGKLQKAMDSAAEQWKLGSWSQSLSSPVPLARAESRTTGSRTTGMSGKVDAESDPDGEAAAEELGTFKVMDHIRTHTQPLQEHNWYRLALERKLKEKSMPQGLLEYTGLLNTRRPANRLVDLVESWWFHALTYLAVAANISWTCYQSDQGVRKALMHPQEDLPDWWDTVDEVWAIIFSVEIILRLLAWRLWFFLTREWLWNCFDLFLVLLAVSTHVVGKQAGGANFTFFRTMKAIRVIRMARVLRILNAFRELRKLMFSVVACLKTLLWCVVFLIVAMIFFSLVIMHGVIYSADAHRSDAHIMHLLREHFDGLDKCVSSLMIVMFGPEWRLYQTILGELGFVSACVMPLFLIFIQVGVTNIVIAVFANESANLKDHDLIVQDQILEVEAFVDAMLVLWKDCAGKDFSAQLEKDAFLAYIRKEEVQAYLASYQIDTSHARVIYAICDGDGSGKVDIKEFVLRLLMLRGSAKALDSTITVSALGEIAQDVLSVKKQNKLISREVTGNFF